MITMDDSEVSLTKQDLNDHWMKAVTKGRKYTSFFDYLTKEVPEVAEFLRRKHLENLSDTETYSRLLTSIVRKDVMVNKVGPFVEERLQQLKDHVPALIASEYGTTLYYGRVDTAMHPFFLIRNSYPPVGSHSLVIKECTLRGEGSGVYFPVQEIQQSGSHISDDFYQMVRKYLTRTHRPLTFYGIEKLTEYTIDDTCVWFEREPTELYDRFIRQSIPPLPGEIIVDLSASEIQKED